MTILERIIGGCALGRLSSQYRLFLTSFSYNAIMRLIVHLLYFFAKSGALGTALSL